MLFDSQGWFPCIGWSSHFTLKDSLMQMDLILKSNPRLLVRLSAQTGPQSVFFFPAPSGWGWDQTCQRPEGGLWWAPDWGWQEARPQVAALLEAHRHGPVGPAGYRGCQSETILEVFPQRQQQMLGLQTSLEAPVRGWLAPRWWHSSLRGVCAQSLHGVRAWAALQGGAPHKPKRTLLRKTGHLLFIQLSVAKPWNGGA